MRLFPPASLFLAVYVHLSSHGGSCSGQAAPTSALARVLQKNESAVSMLNTTNLGRDKDAESGAESEYGGADSDESLASAAQPSQGNSSEGEERADLSTSLNDANGRSTTRILKQSDNSPQPTSEGNLSHQDKPERREWVKFSTSPNDPNVQSTTRILIQSGNGPLSTSEGDFSIWLRSAPVRSTKRAPSRRGNYQLPTLKRSSVPSLYGAAVQSTNRTLLESGNDHHSTLEGDFSTLNEASARSTKRALGQNGNDGDQPTVEEDPSAPLNNGPLRIAKRVLLQSGSDPVPLLIDAPARSTKRTLLRSENHHLPAGKLDSSSSSSSYAPVQRAERALQRSGIDDQLSTLQGDLSTFPNVATVQSTKRTLLQSGNKHQPTLKGGFATSLDSATAQSEKRTLLQSENHRLPTFDGRFATPLDSATAQSEERILLQSGNHHLPTVSARLLAGAEKKTKDPQRHDPSHQTRTPCSSAPVVPAEMTRQKFKKLLMLLTLGSRKYNKEEAAYDDRATVVDIIRENDPLELENMELLFWEAYQHANEEEGDASSFLRHLNRYRNVAEPPTSSQWHTKI